MVNIRSFGKKLKTPPTFQIKHQFLFFWLKNQAAKETAEVTAQKISKGKSLHVHDACS